MTDTLDTNALEPGETDDNQGDPPALPTLEELAVEAGWKPEDQWKGDKSKWTPAHEYLRHATELSVSRKDELRSLTRRMDKVAKANDRMLETALAEQRRDLMADYQDAVAANKPKEAAQIVRKMDALTNEAEDPAAEFKERNKGWYEVDDDATTYAVGVAERNKHLPPDEQLEKVEEAVKRKYPELFGAAKKQAPVVNSPTTRTPAPRAKTWDSLPPEARSSCQSFENRLPTPEKKADFRKRYVAEYYGSQD